MTSRIFVHWTVLYLSFLNGVKGMSREGTVFGEMNDSEWGYEAIHIGIAMNNSFFLSHETRAGGRVGSADIRDSDQA